MTFATLPYIWNASDLSLLEYHLALQGLSGTAASQLAGIAASDFYSAKARPARHSDTLNRIAAATAFTRYTLNPAEAALLKGVRNDWSAARGEHVMKAITDAGYTAHTFAVHTKLAASSTLNSWALGLSSPRAIPLMRVLATVGVKLEALNSLPGRNG